MVAAVHRVALNAINADVVIDVLQGYIEYASHTRQGIDSPVGLAFRTYLPPGESLATLPGRLDWFRQLPDEKHDEQREFPGRTASPAEPPIAPLEAAARSSRCPAMCHWWIGVFAASVSPPEHPEDPVLSLSADSETDPKFGHWSPGGGTFDPDDELRGGVDYR